MWNVLSTVNLFHADDTQYFHFMNDARKMNKIMHIPDIGYIFWKLVPLLSSSVLKIIDSFHSYSSLFKAKTICICRAFFLPVSIPVYNSCIPQTCTACSILRQKLSMRLPTNTFKGRGGEALGLCISDCSVPHPAYSNLAGIKLKPGF